MDASGRRHRLELESPPRSFPVLGVLSLDKSEQQLEAEKTSLAPLSLISVCCGHGTWEDVCGSPSSQR